MTASELFSLAHGLKCTGDESCRYCGNPCQKLHMSQDQLPTIYLGTDKNHKRHSNGLWMCNGCFLFRRPSITIFWFGKNEYSDRQCPMNHSWWITDKKALALRANDPTIFSTLLDPPEMFSLLVCSPKETNAIHLAPVNNGEVTRDTPIKYLFNGQVFEYTIRELQSALEQKTTEGISGGVRMLIETFGYSSKYRKKTKAGRPKTHAGDMLVMSG